jgi:hypothetical protein
VIPASPVVFLPLHTIEINNATNKKPQKTRDNAVAGDDPAAALSRILYGRGAVGIKTGFLESTIRRSF